MDIERKTMTDTASPTVETPAREKKSASRIVTAIVRILLGLMFLVFGLNGFLNFMPAPKDIPPEIMNVMGALMNAGYMTVESGAEVIFDVMLLTNRFVQLVFDMLSTIISGIVTCSTVY